MSAVPDKTPSSTTIAPMAIAHAECAKSAALPRQRIKPQADRADSVKNQREFFFGSAGLMRGRHL